MMPICRSVPVSRVLAVARNFRAVVGVALAIHFASQVYAEAVRLTTLTDDSVETKILGVNEDGVVDLADGAIKLNQLRSLERAVLPNTNAADAVHVHLGAGGVLLADSVSIVDERCIVEGHGLGDKEIRIPIDLVRSIHLQPRKISKEIADTQEERDEDQLVLLVGGAVESMYGLVEGLNEQVVTFVWGEQTRDIPRKNLVAIGIASTESASEAKCLVRFLNGSSLPGSIQSLKDNLLRLRVAEELSVSVDWRIVHKIDFRSDKLQYLATLEPRSFEHRPIVTSKRTWKKDRNVSGKNLMLGDRVYSNGIGVASYSLLKYDLGAEYQTFCATVGIDAETRGRGECIFVVRGDGKELFRETTRATDDPRKLKIDISGVRELELIVEPGADLDLADHANWCDACLLRK